MPCWTAAAASGWSAGASRSWCAPIPRPSGNPGVEIQLDSTVMGLYGRQITQVIAETAAECGVDGVRIVASDKGALDCTIRARVKTAILRACDSQDYGWTVKNYVRRIVYETLRKAYALPESF